jgi:hypothetical protein
MELITEACVETFDYVPNLGTVPRLFLVLMFHVSPAEQTARRQPHAPVWLGRWLRLPRSIVSNRLEKKLMCCEYLYRPSTIYFQARSWIQAS